MLNMVWRNSKTTWVRVGMTRGKSNKIMLWYLVERFHCEAWIGHTIKWKITQNAKQRRRQNGRCVLVLRSHGGTKLGRKIKVMWEIDKRQQNKLQAHRHRLTQEHQLEPYYATMNDEFLGTGRNSDIIESILWVGVTSDISCGLPNRNWGREINMTPRKLHTIIWWIVILERLKMLTPSECYSEREGLSEKYSSR